MRSTHRTHPHRTRPRTHDADGQRATATVTAAGVATTTTYDYDGLVLRGLTATRAGVATALTYAYDAAGAPRGGTWASGEATPVAFTAVTSARGDVLELRDADGAPFATYAYDAYGADRGVETTATALVDAPTAAAIAAANVLRYAGYCYDAYAGLYYLSQRYYDPATASFTTKDPARADGEQSPYQYCGGDPVNQVDPTGERAIAFVKPPYRGRAQLAEVGQYLLNVMRVNGGYAQLPWHYNSALWFMASMWPKGPWDFKMAWGSNLRSKPAFKFFGIPMTPEQFGDMHYGYVAAATGFDPAFAAAGSFAAHVFPSKLSKILDPFKLKALANEYRDQLCIIRGRLLFLRYGTSIKSNFGTDRYVLSGKQ